EASQGQDVFLDPEQMREVLHNDRVRVRIIGQDWKGRPAGRIVEVLKHANLTVIGRMHHQDKMCWVVPLDLHINQDIFVPDGQDMDAPENTVVTVSILQQPNRSSSPVGKVIEIIGSYTDPGMEIEIALRTHQLPYVFSSKAQIEASKFSPEFSDSDLKNREDLRAIRLVTIDGETARDFDDAVFCEKTKDGFKLIVAIADVSQYVQASGPLDQEAFDRGNSVYFPRRVIPMLPESLSNDLCSLKPKVDRLCLACEMMVDESGEIYQYRFFSAIMCSHARLTYSQVANILNGSINPGQETEGVLVEGLNNLYLLYRVLSAARERRGAIDFETVEIQLIFDDRGKIARIEPTVRNDAYRIIEECMLAANVCAASFLTQVKQPFLYRIHEGPTLEKLERLRDFLREFGLSIGGGDNPNAKDYAKLLEKIRDRPDCHLIQTVMLRSLSQAVYSPENVGHFGLGYEMYTHFTSPIRRYPDLLVHRAIKAQLAGKTYRPGDLKKLGEHCSMTERRADEATRDVESWLKCYFMQDKLGENFEGTISGVTGFGLFVQLNEYYVDGLVHITDLGQDYFRFDATRHALVGEHTRVEFRLGGAMCVKVARVDLERSKIDFVPAGEDVQKFSRKRKKKS
ncbi:MAG: ribonuclease R, partial [Pseudomonadota bacterium]|nr:ribonuclease R [Pseudomonadota bacterium]